MQTSGPVPQAHAAAGLVYNDVLNVAHRAAAPNELALQEDRAARHDMLPLSVCVKHTASRMHREGSSKRRADGRIMRVGPRWRRVPTFNDADVVVWSAVECLERLWAQSVSHHFIRHHSIRPMAAGQALGCDSRQ